MKMSELSDRSGVAVPTIKFYLREGLLAPGERTSPNQSAYDDSHVERLRLVRALIDVGGLSVAATSAVLTAIDSPEIPLNHAFETAQKALPGVLPEADDAAPGPGAAAVEAQLADRGWFVTGGNPGRPVATRVLDTYERLGLDNLHSVLPAYLDAAELIARADLDAVAAASDRAHMVETVVVGTVLGDALLAGLRRIAQERESHLRFGTPPGPDTDCETGASS